MIKNGNYYFFDFDKHKDKFMDVFTEFYEDRNAEEVKKRMDTIVYIPYLEPEVIYDYYDQLMNEHKSELVKEFIHLMGIEKANKKLTRLLWDDQEFYSPLVQCIAEGNNLEVMPIENENWRDEQLQTRQEAYEVFGIEGDDAVKFTKLQDIVRTFNIAMRNIEEKYPCDVFRDMKKYQQNKVAALQMYLIKMSKLAYPFTEKDLEIINKPDFDFVDANNLDCNNILFQRNVGNPGFYTYFTSEMDEILNKSKNPSDIEKVLMGRLKYWAINLDGCDEFEFVSYNELFGGVKPRDIDDFIERMQQELYNLSQKYPEYAPTAKSIDNIETIRKLYADGLYSGCKFAKNINREYQDTVHNPFSASWCTYLDYENNDYNKPLNFICFNESGEMDPVRLLANLIHEVNHALSHGEAVMHKSKKAATTRLGILTNVKKATKDGKLDINYKKFDNGILMLEENVNERLSQELLDIFLSKYECPFEESDKVYRDQTQMECLYNYWDFLTEEFYQRFKDCIKEHRINPNYDMYFDFDKQEATKTDTIINTIKSKYLRFAYPDSFSTYGVLDYRKVEKLGKIIALFQDSVVPELTSRDVGIADFLDPQNDKYKTLPLYIRDLIVSASDASNIIVSAMVEDYENINNYQEAIMNGENPQRPNAVVATTKAVGRFAKKQTNKAIKFVASKFKKNKANEDITFVVDENLLEQPEENNDDNEVINNEAEQDSPSNE